MTLTKSERRYIEGYATALQNMMMQITGSNSCGKSYDPVSFDETTLHSYAFDLKNGGRHHPLVDFKSVQEITDLMLKEASKWCTEDDKRNLFIDLLGDELFRMKVELEISKRKNTLSAAEKFEALGYK